MNAEFNPLASSLLFTRPLRLHTGSAWIEHTPFALLLVELARPRVIVELGTHWGASYCTFCQAVAALKLPTRCYAVDTWTGDPHAGLYGHEVFDDLSAYHKKYESFSQLLRMTFDDALKQVPDQSVDLLHIDGLHSYEAVKHDYESWRPKLSSRAIVLFHDTAVHERGFGVHQLWAELSPQFPNFHFEHGHGLGVLATGPEISAAAREFLATANAHPAATRALFSALGHQIKCDVDRVATAAALAAEAKRPWLRRKLGRIIDKA